MKSYEIVFYNHGKAFLPAIPAYMHFFEKLGITCKLVNKAQGFEPYGRIHWKFMGVVPDKPGEGQHVVHEYTSTSIPPLPRIKDLVKKTRNSKPDLRIFQNNHVRSVYNYKDDVPYLFRPVACNEVFFNNDVHAKKEYDYVYCGALDATRNVGPVLIRLLRHFNDRRFIIVGEPSKNMYEKFRVFKNIKFTGRVAQNAVPSLLAQSKYGLNLVPNVYPYNHLISTKLLEYCAMGLPVITFGGKWVESFELETQGRFFRLDKYPLTMLEEFDYIVPDVRKYRAEAVIKNSGILDWLNSVL